jgi:hypothetical protein
VRARLGSLDGPTWVTPGTCRARYGRSTIPRRLLTPPIAGALRRPRETSGVRPKRLRARRWWPLLLSRRGLPFVVRSAQSAALRMPPTPAASCSRGRGHQPPPASPRPTTRVGGSGTTHDRPARRSHVAAPAQLAGSWRYRPPTQASRDGRFRFRARTPRSRGDPPSRRSGRRPMVGDFADLLIAEAAFLGSVFSAPIPPMYATPKLHDDGVLYAYAAGGANTGTEQLLDRPMCRRRSAGRSQACQGQKTITPAFHVGTQVGIDLHRSPHLRMLETPQFRQRPAPAVPGRHRCSGRHRRSRSCASTSARARSAGGRRR